MSQQSEDQARSEVLSIIKFVDDYKRLDAVDDTDAQEELVNEAIADIVETGTIQSSFVTLCWGGPEVQVLVTKDEHGDPLFYKVQHRSWLEGWQDLPLTTIELDALRDWCDYLGVIQ